VRERLRARVEERREALGEEGLRKAKADWAALVQQFTGGAAGIHASLNRMYETEGVERASRGAVSPDLFAWMGEAVAARAS
jgi:hypothetical protein